MDIREAAALTPTSKQRKGCLVCQHLLSLFFAFYQKKQVKTLTNFKNKKLTKKKKKIKTSFTFMLHENIFTTKKHLLNKSYQTNEPIFTAINRPW